MSAGTAYSKRYAGGFADQPATTSAIDSAFLNAVETALLQLLGVAPTADGQVAQWDNGNTRFGPALILNKNIDAAAAIAKSKLDFTGGNGIVNADIASAAAIAKSKLAPLGIVDADVSAISYSKLASVPVLAGAQLDYAQLVAPTSGISATTEGTANTVIDGNATTYDGTKNRIEFWAPSITWDAGASNVTFALLRDTTVLGQSKIETASAASDDGPLYLLAFDTPAAGSHTYHLKAFVNTGTATTVNAGAGGSGNRLPAFLRVTKA